VHTGNSSSFLQVEKETHKFTRLEFMNGSGWKGGMSLFTSDQKG